MTVITMTVDDGNRHCNKNRQCKNFGYFGKLSIKNIISDNIWIDSLFLSANGTE